MTSMVFELAMATPLALITVPLLGFFGATLYRDWSGRKASFEQLWIPCLLQIFLLLAAIGIAIRGEVVGLNVYPNENQLASEK